MTNGTHQAAFDGSGLFDIRWPSPEQLTVRDETMEFTLPKTAVSAAPDPRVSLGDDLEDFFENGAIALHLVGADGTILKANKAELELLGYTAEEYIGRRVSDFHADRSVIDDILIR